MEEMIYTLNKNDWIVLCESPLEIEYKHTGDKAFGEAAIIIFEYYRIQNGLCSAPICEKDTI